MKIKQEKRLKKTKSEVQTRHKEEALPVEKEYQTKEIIPIEENLEEQEKPAGSKRNLSEYKKHVKHKKRIEYIDIAKGIGIILVVWAHARAPFTNHIYQFHMPFFFYLSGMLYSNKSKPFEFIVKKIKGLYIPFVFWNLLFYCTKTAIRGTLSVQEILLILATLSKDGQFLGATWFLGSLFAVTVVYRLVDAMVPSVKIKSYLMLMICIGISVAGFYFNLPYLLSRTLVLVLFFGTGAFIKTHNPELPKALDIILTVVFAAIFVIIGNNNTANMGLNEYTSPVLFVIGAFFATYALLYLCRLIEKFNGKYIVLLKRMLIYIGKHSLDIVIWQFVAFRIVIIIQMLINHEALTFESVLSYYPVYYCSNGWWIAYTAVGVAVPLLWCALLRSGKVGKLLQKIHIV